MSRQRRGRRGRRSVRWLSSGRSIFWIAALVVFVALLWLLSDVLLPFVAGMALAYLLDPLADRLERLGVAPAVSRSS